MSETPKRIVAKYERLAAILEQNLDEKRWHPGDQLPPERQLADDYCMSHMTVNKAVASLVAKGLLQRRGRATYVSKPEAAPLSRAVGTVLNVRPELDPILLHPLLNCLAKAGRMPLIIDMDEPVLVEQQFRELTQEGVDVFIIDAYSMFSFQALERTNPCPRVIFIHRYEAEHAYPGTKILLDYRSVGRLSARTALARGCRFPAIAGFHREPLWTSQRFYEGVMEILDAAGVKLQAEWLTNDMTDADVKAELGRHPHVDSILTINDFRLLPFSRAAAALGRTVPDDLFMIGAGNTPHARLHGYPSISLEQDRLIELAMEALNSASAKSITIEAKTVNWNTTPPEVN